MPDSYWLIQAQDALQNSLGAGNLRAGVYEGKVRELSGLLEETFPEAEAVLVAGCLRGHSANPDKQVLRVEAITGGVSRARIVKIGPADALQRELDGWRDCSRTANDRGRVQPCDDVDF